MKKNVFSRTLAVLASTAVLGAASMISASAAGEAISLSDVVGQPGETVTMPIAVSANNDCNSFDLLVAWDDATLTGSAATFSGCTVLGDQMVSVVGYTSSTMADGAVASINFTIPEDAEDGQVYNVTISSVTSFSTATDGDVAVDSLSLSNGTITVEIPEETKVIVVPEKGVGRDYPFSKEKLSPVLTYYISKNDEEGMDIAEKLLEFGGLGHSAVIHSENKETILKFSEKMKAGRIIVNSPSTHGAIGDIYNTNMPSLTLGCGSFGGNSTTANVSSVNLINIKRVAKRRVNMQWFKVPEKIYFEAGSIAYLEKMPDIERAFIVTDPGMVKLGYVDKILYHLRKRSQYVHSEIFSEVESDPSFDTIKKGVAAMNNFKPDVIIAVGGGSPMDAAKGMWLFYEHPEADVEGLKLKFMDIRKRTYKFPKLGQKAKMVAIPTTSGTGSEVTSFAVITDKQKNKKYPLADYELTPDVAIVDPDLVMSLPKSVTADTGMDVLTHAIESYVSNMASDYTDGLAEKASELVVTYLEQAYDDGTNKLAREKMHNASTIAGMAFTNAFLGINHSLAHKLGAEFHIPHGRINAILLPYVIKYNSSKPTKFVSFPKYEYFIADQKYYELAKKLGLKADNVEEGVNSLIEKIKQMNEHLGIPKSIKDAGIDEKEFLAKVDMLADRAFEDQCTTANPRLPLVSELKQIMLDCYYGK